MSKNHLDVDRLLRAISRTPGFGRDRDYAERLAAEYARLMNKEEDMSGEPLMDEMMALYACGRQVLGGKCSRPQGHAGAHEGRLRNSEDEPSAQ